MNRIIIVLIVLGSMVACNNSYTPKPPAYFRISFPEKVYQATDNKLPYTFEYPTYTLLKADTSRGAEPFWTNLYFPDFNAGIHITYKVVDGNLPNLLEDARTMAFKHTVKADAIDEQIFVNPNSKVSGLMYTIKGNAASQIQFYLTDSNRHFLRGALYFNEHPNKDSLAPVVAFVSEDIVHLIESVQWNEQ